MKKAFILALFSLVLSYQANAQKEVSEVYAVFLYTFTKHVDNPVKTGEYKISIVGDSKLLQEMQKFNGAKASSGQVIRIVDGENLQDVAGSRLVFVSGNKSSKLKEIKELCNQALFVTERNGMLSSGSCINFLHVGNRISFEISEQACQEQGLRVSSKLIALSKSS